MIFALVPLQDVNVQSTTDLLDQASYPKTHCLKKPWLAILRHPSHVQMDLEHTVCPMTIINHGDLFYRIGTLKPSPKGEGFDPPNTRH